MQAALRRLHSPDLGDLEHGQPSDPACFSILVQALIGPRGGDGEESFDFLVCTPSWVATRLNEGAYLFGQHYLFLARYDYATMHRAISGICGRAEGNDWTSVAKVLARYGRWEFEDYGEPTPR